MRLGCVTITAQSSLPPRALAAPAKASRAAARTQGGVEAGRAGAVEPALQSVPQQHGPEPLSLTAIGGGLATDQHGAHQRVARHVLARRLRHIALRDRHGAPRVVAQHLGRSLTSLRMKAAFAILRTSWPAQS